MLFRRPNAHLQLALLSLRLAIAALLHTFVLSRLQSQRLQPQHQPCFLLRLLAWTCQLLLLPRRFHVHFHSLLAVLLLVRSAVAA